MLRKAGAYNDFTHNVPIQCYSSTVNSFHAWELRYLSHGLSDDDRSLDQFVHGLLNYLMSVVMLVDCGYEIMQ